jgi:hypothetical protein
MGSAIAAEVDLMVSFQPPTSAAAYRERVTCVCRSSKDALALAFAEAADVEDLLQFTSECGYGMVCSFGLWNLNSTTYFFDQASLG